ncbi:MAG: RcnB family protein [Sphingomonadales bacterium]|nr:RcnB family protein [Sphingomonadales bacterium]
MAHKFIGGLLAAATVLTPVAASAAPERGVKTQITDSIVLAQRADRNDRRTQRRPAPRGEASGPRNTRGEVEVRRDHRRDRRDDNRDYRQERRADDRALRQGRVTSGEYRRDRRDDRQDYRQERREDARDYRRDSNGANAVRRYDDRRRETTREYRDQRSWSRDWRRDRRYDYRTYRSSHRDVFRLGRYYAPYRDYRYRRLSVGFNIGSLFYGNRYWLNDPWQYRLPAARYPYRWVRYYDDALLVDTRRGIVVDVIYNVFW